MQKITSFILLFVIASFSLQAQKKASPKKEKKTPIEKIIKFKTLEHDFGNLVEGGKVAFDFEYKNIGRLPIILTNVTAQCGCTVPAWSKTPVKRKKSSKITVTYNTAGRPGAFKKKITVNTNQGVQYVWIKGVVKPAPKK